MPSGRVDEQDDVGGVGFADDAEETGSAHDLEDVELRGDADDDELSVSFGTMLTLPLLVVLYR